MPSRSLRLWGLCVALLLAVVGLPSQASAQGFLIPTTPSVEPLTLKSHRVQVAIHDRAAKTEVSQIFVNHTDRLLEATYLFPLPAGATITDFVLYIDGKPTRGQVLVKEKAHAIYQDIVRRMQDPGLIDYMGNNLFQARIFPIPRRGEQKIKISFSQVLPYQSGLLHYIYPLKAPRQQVLQVQQDFTLALTLQSKTPIKNIYSPSHRISARRIHDRKAIVGFEESRVALDRDFSLYYSVSPKELGLNLLTYKPEGDEGYFMLMVTPKSSHSSKELQSKNVTFVLDTSGSMEGEKMKWAKIALASCLKKLHPNDYFNVVRFSTDVEAIFPKLQKADGATVSEAIRFVEKMEAAGATAIEDALKLAFAQKPQGDGVSLMVFITDGHPTVGETDPKLLQRMAQENNRFKTRVFTFGIGTDINIQLLDKIAQDTGGTGDYLAPSQEIATRIESFYEKVRYPVLTDVRLAFSGAAHLYDFYPKQLPDLFRGGQVLVLGRYRKPGATAVSVEGKLSGSAKKYVYEDTFPAQATDHAFLARLWANRKVAYLLDHIRLKGEHPEIKNEVIRLATAYQIVTPYTSFLVVEEKDRWRLGPSPMQQSQTATPPGTQQPRPMEGFANRGGAENERRRSEMGRGDRPAIARRWAPSKSGGRASPSMEPSVAPAPAAPPPEDSSLADKRSLDEASGEAAIRVSRKLKKMKEATTADNRSGSLRLVKDRRFIWRSGQGWVDQGFQTSMKIFKVKAFSALYFQILKKKPELKAFFALGSHLVIKLDSKRALQIGDDEDPSASFDTFLR